MKFTKFALLLAIALSVFSIPRVANADGWSTKGYMIIGEFHHGYGASVSPTSLSISATGGLSGGDQEIASQITWIWTGSSYPSILAVNVSGYVDAFAIAFDSSSSAAISIFNLTVGDQTTGFSPPVIPMVSAPGAKGLSVSTALYVLASGISSADASWAVVAK